MGVISTLFGGTNSVAAIGTAVRGVAEVFTPSATRKMELSAEAQIAALGQFGAEYANPAQSWFDRMVNGLNRLPRPFLAFGTLGLFTYAMVDPISFGERMVGLNLVPDPLWWLLGAIVGFYFGAREAHYFRQPIPMVINPAEQASSDADPNPALEDWRGKH